MAGLKNKFKLNRDEEKTYTRTFKSDEEVNIMSYKLPKITKKYTNADATDEILNFVNYKRDKMNDIKKYKDADISVAIEYASGKYISTPYTDISQEIEFQEWAEYDDLTLKEMGKIVSFSIQFITR